MNKPACTVERSKQRDCRWTGDWCLTPEGRKTKDSKKYIYGYHIIRYIFFIFDIVVTDPFLDVTN